MNRIIRERLIKVFNRSGKCPLRDAHSQENVCRAFFCSGKYQLGMYLVGEMSVGQLSGRAKSGRGSVHRGCLWSGKFPLGMCLVGEVSFGEVFFGEMSVGGVSGTPSLVLKVKFRSSRLQMFFKIGVLKFSQYYQHLCWNNFIKKRLQHQCFSMNIAKFLRTAMAASGYIHYFLVLLFLTLSSSPFFFFLCSPIIANSYRMATSKRTLKNLDPLLRIKSLSVKFSKYQRQLSGSALKVFAKLIEKYKKYP